MYYNIEPVPKPTMTRRDQWLKPPRPKVARYRAFADACRMEIGNDFNLNNCTICFGITMPKSWSEKRKLQMDKNPHQSTPDLSNLLKALEDALYSKRYTGRQDNDAVVHQIEGLSKIWARNGFIWISV